MTDPPEDQSEQESGAVDPQDEAEAGPAEGQEGQEAGRADDPQVVPPDTPTDEAADPEDEGRRARSSPPPARGGRRGRGTRPMDPDRPCLNCGDPTHGEYCPTCGQRKVVVQVSVRTLVMDVLEDQFILDKRLPRTLGTLLFKPGYMTVEHVNGRVVRYIHPFRLYLVTSLLFFLLLSFFGMRLVRQAAGEGERRVATVVDSLAREESSARSTLATIDLQLADTTLNPIARQTLERTRARLAAQLDTLEAGQDSLADIVPGVVGTEADTATGDTAGSPQAPRAPPVDSVEEEMTLAEAFGWDEGDGPQVNIAIPAVDSIVSTRLDRLGEMTPREAAVTLTDTFFNWAPTLMFILLPVFAVVLKLLYIRRRRYYAEHFVFLLHVHSFVFLLATIMLLLNDVVGGWLEAVLAVWMLVYIYLAMLRVYGQGWLKTFAKYWTLGWMYFWILAFSIPIAFVGTILLF